MSWEEELRKSKEEWESEAVRQALNRQKERKDGFQTDSGIEVKPLYTPLDLEEIGFDYRQDLGFPGQYPFTRGTDPLGYRQNFWVFGQYAGYGGAEETNKRYRFLLEHGETGIDVALDLPTQMGYNSDHPLAEGEVGKIGVSIDSLQDIEDLFEGIPLDKPREINSPVIAIGPIWLAMLLVLAEKQGVSPERCKIRMGSDILQEYYSRGTYIFPPQPAVSITTDAAIYCAEHYPHWKPITVCSYHVREAGGNAAQEIAFTISTAIAYIEDAIRKGVNPEQFVSMLSVFLSSGMDLFEEVAKLRAMRRLWARILKQRYSISNPDLLRLWLPVMTGGSNLTAQQPMNNIARVAIESLAAVLGGCQVLYASSMDEAFATPTEQAVKVALRTQQIIAHETGIARTADPLAGSYFVECLTAELERRAQKYIDKIDEMGGAVRAVESGYFHQEIAKSAYETKRQIEDGDKVVVGVNQYVDEEELPLEILKVDPALERRQKEKLKKLKEERNNLEVRKALKGVRQAVENSDNLVPSLISAVRVYATVGEICDTLREVHGEYPHQVYI